MTTIAEVEDLVRRHEIDAALEEIGRMLEERPDDAEASMLFGVCQQMKGRTEAFCEVYRDLAPSMSVRDSSGEDSPVVSRWRHYCKVAAYLVAIGVITLAGTGSAEPATNRLDEVDAPQAVEAKASEKVTDVEQLKNLPCGVQNIKYDENGVISSLMVVGKRAVPKALARNPGRAAQYGGEAARSEAQLEFTRFLSTKCKWGKTTDGETAVKEETASATDTQGNEISAKSSLFTETEMTKEQKAQSAQASVSEIQILWEGLNDGGEYVWVGAWNAKALKVVKPLEPIIEPEPMSRYNMGGRPIRPPHEVFSKYNMGGRPIEVVF